MSRVGEAGKHAAAVRAGRRSPPGTATRKRRDIEASVAAPARGGRRPGRRQGRASGLTVRSPRAGGGR
jgi:hypothetical protein